MMSKPKIIACLKLALLSFVGIGMYFLMSATYARDGFSVAIGEDVKHSMGTPYTELRYTIERTSSYAALDAKDGVRVGGDYLFLSWLAVGATLAKPDNEVGTLARYELRAILYNSRHYDIDLVHESNCSSLCRKVPGLSGVPHGSDDTANDGQNWLVIRFKL